MQRQKGNTGVLALQAACPVHTTRVLANFSRRLWQCTWSGAEDSKQGAIARRRFPEGGHLAITLQSVWKRRPNSATFLNPLPFISPSCRGRSRLCRQSNPCSAFNGRSWLIPSKTGCTSRTIALLTDRSAISKDAQCWECGVYAPHLHLAGTCVAQGEVAALQDYSTLIHSS